MHNFELLFDRGKFRKGYLNPYSKFKHGQCQSRCQKVLGLILVWCRRASRLLRAVLIYMVYSVDYRPLLKAVNPCVPGTLVSKTMQICASCGIFRPEKYNVIIPFVIQSAVSDWCCYRIDLRRCGIFISLVLVIPKYILYEFL